MMTTTNPDEIRTDLTQAMIAALIYLPDGLSEIKAALAQVTHAMADDDAENGDSNVIQ